MDQKQKEKNGEEGQLPSSPLFLFILFRLRLGSFFSGVPSGEGFPFNFQEIMLESGIHFPCFFRLIRGVGRSDGVFPGFCGRKCHSGILVQSGNLDEINIGATVYSKGIRSLTEIGVEVKESLHFALFLQVEPQNDMFLPDVDPKRIPSSLLELRKTGIGETDCFRKRDRILPVFRVQRNGDVSPVQADLITVEFEIFPFSSDMEGKDQSSDALVVEEAETGTEGVIVSADVVEVVSACEENVFLLRKGPGDF